MGGQTFIKLKIIIMKKTIKRGVAAILYNLMAKMSFGQLKEETLEVVMDNFMALGKEAEHYQKMLEEMNKRILNGIDEATIKDYNAMAEKSTEEEMEKAFPTIYPLVKKQHKVSEAIFNKEVEVELAEVDRKEFCKGVMKGTPNLTAGILANFDIMFKEGEKKEDDFSELDALMNE